MTGMIKTKAGHTFIFRNDHGFDSDEFWAWNIHDAMPGDRLKTHKWKKLPRGFVTIFDIENPPDTVGYIPILR